ncbi:sialate O-acetylesterase [Roseateles sp.]|uniref:sialate O-acetylesterase n=1 Tax=Roseateles sp. TaxID=1971397 RepID=UPI003D0D8812
MNWRAATLLACLAGLSSAVQAEVRLHGLFGEHMVLQREAPIPVWGWAEPGETVRLQFRGQSQTAQADAEGRWRVRLKPEAAGGPHTLRVSGSRSAKALVLGDVLVGEVWLCSGQSNMEWALRDSLNGPAEAAAARDDGIRHIKVAHRAALQPQDDIASAAWQPATAAHAAEFSAVAYHFAKRLRRELGVPVGLLNVSWGGTQIEAWMSPAALKSLADIAPLLEAPLPSSERDFVAQQEARMLSRVKAWQGSGPAGAAEAESWANPDLDDRTWSSLQAPGIWETQGLKNLDGKLWYRKTLQLTPAQAAAPEAVLHLAQVDDCDEAFVNGQPVGAQCGWDRPRRYLLPSGLLRAGANVIAVRVSDQGMGGGIHGTPEQLRLHLGVQEGAQVGAQDLTLAGSWQARVESLLDKTEPGPNELPSLLFNGMLHPVQGFGLRGMLWYQGESNVARAAQYERLLPAFISDLRARWGQGDFPFHLVQIAAENPAALNTLTGSAWAELREAQTRALRLPRTGLVVTSDVADDGNLHPRNKQVVGERLAGLALQQSDKKKTWQAQGPVYRSMKRRGREIELRFDHAGTGLSSTGAALQGFTIADASGRFLPAQARIVGQTVRVHHDAIQHPVAVRFGWVDNPQHNNLFNRAGLPAVPFRTDRWPRLTEQARYAF